MIGVRVSPELRKTIEIWAQHQADKPGLSEAIRRLLEVALATFTPVRRSTVKSLAKASDMAGETIDRQADRSATVEERESRKRRLLKGPKEFRDLRRDHPSKTKRPM